MRIALVHAVAVAIEPINAAFARAWPEADCMNLLDDRLSVDRAKTENIGVDIYARIHKLAAYARDSGACAVQFTCSAFGPAIDAAAKDLDLPVLKPNDAMFEESLCYGRRIGMVASFAPSIAPMAQEYEDLLSAKGMSVGLETACAPDAMEALREGDGKRHDDLLAQAAKSLSSCDAIMLAQFSTARAKDAVCEATGKRVLTSPDSAVGSTAPDTRCWVFR